MMKTSVINGHIGLGGVILYTLNLCGVAAILLGLTATSAHAQWVFNSAVEGAQGTQNSSGAPILSGTAQPNTGFTTPPVTTSSGTITSMASASYGINCSAYPSGISSSASGQCTAQMGLGANWAGGYTHPSQGLQFTAICDVMGQIIAATGTSGDTATAQLSGGTGTGAALMASEPSDYQNAGHSYATGSLALTYPQYSSEGMPVDNNDPPTETGFSSTMTATEINGLNTGYSTEGQLFSTEIVTLTYPLQDLLYGNNYEGNIAGININAESKMSASNTRYGGSAATVICFALEQGTPH